MRRSDAFRRKLQRRLRHIAEDRRRAAAGQPSGQDLKVMARCTALATSCESIDHRLCDAVETVLADPAKGCRFAAAWDELPEAIGITLWPETAADLVGWLLREADPAATPTRRTRLVASPVSRAGVRHETEAGPSLAASVASDFTGALAVVGPALAVWYVGTGLHQWRDLGFAAHRPSATARVVAVPPNVERGATPTYPGTIIFTPVPGALECRIGVDLGKAMPIGATLAVVPRSRLCEAPLVPATIGDPAASLALAAAFAISGLVSLKTWGWLRVRAEHYGIPTMFGRVSPLSLVERGRG